MKAGLPPRTQACPPVAATRLLPAWGCSPEMRCQGTVCFAKQRCLCTLGLSVLAAPSTVPPQPGFASLRSSKASFTKPSSFLSPLTQHTPSLAIVCEESNDTAVSRLHHCLLLPHSKNSSRFEASSTSTQKPHSWGGGETWPSRLSLAFPLPPLLFADTSIMCVLAKLPHILFGD